VNSAMLKGGGTVQGERFQRKWRSENDESGESEDSRALISWTYGRMYLLCVRSKLITVNLFAELVRECTIDGTGWWANCDGLSEVWPTHAVPVLQGSNKPVGSRRHTVCKHSKLSRSIGSRMHALLTEYVCSEPLHYTGKSIQTK
jgi:hypothetical protein